MIRIYTKHKKLTVANDVLKRFDGGNWFTEEYEDGDRKSYKVVQRNALSDSETILEFLEELEDNFIQLPCWQDVVQEHRPYSEWSVLSFPLPWPPSSLYLPQPLWCLRNEIEEKVKSYMTYEPQVSSNQSSPLQHHKQDLKQKVKSPLQKIQQPQSSFENQIFDLREEKQVLNQEQELNPFQQILSPVPFSAVPKGVQVGSLCSPVNLPDEQPPRKSPRRPKEQRKPLSQIRPKISNQCLIDPSVS